MVVLGAGAGQERVGEQAWALGVCRLGRLVRLGLRALGLLLLRVGKIASPVPPPPHDRQALALGQCEGEGAKCVPLGSVEGCMPLGGSDRSDIRNLPSDSI